MEKNKNSSEDIGNKHVSKYDDLISNVDKNLLIKWKNEQDYLKSKLIEYDDIGFQYDTESDMRFQRIAGMDISASKSDPNIAIAALVVCDVKTFEILYEKYELVIITQPYVPGFLAFREVEHLAKLIEDLKNNRPDLLPQIILIDGNGILHSNRFGLACHLGVLCDIPTIGCSKTVFSVDGIDKFKVREQSKLLKSSGDFFCLTGNSGQTWGVALKSTEETIDPIIVSIGHKISLETSLKIVKNTTKFRVPEPIRISDKKSRHIINEYNRNNIFEVEKYLNKEFLKKDDNKLSET